MKKALAFMTSKKDSLIVWLDLETSGTIPERDFVLEVGALCSDLDGRQIGEPFQSIVNVPSIPEVIDSSSLYVRKMHEKSGLWLDMWRSPSLSVSEIDDRISMWLKNTIEYYGGDSIREILLGGNSITLDRNFVRINFPRLSSALSHRSIDMTSVSIFFSSINLPSESYIVRKHRALSDAMDSLEEFRIHQDLTRKRLGL